MFGQACERCLGLLRQPGFGYSFGEFGQQSARLRRADVFQHFQGTQLLEVFNRSPALDTFEEGGGALAELQRWPCGQRSSQRALGQYVTLL
jgi:hypothetical protein